MNRDSFCNLEAVSAAVDWQFVWLETAAAAWATCAGIAPHTRSGTETYRNALCEVREH